MEGYPVHTLSVRVKLNVIKINNGMFMSLYQKSRLTPDKIDPRQLKQNVAAWAAVSYLAAELKD